MGRVAPRRCHSAGGSDNSDAGPDTVRVMRAPVVSSRKDTSMVHSAVAVASASGESSKCPVRISVGVASRRCSTEAMRPEIAHRVSHRGWLTPATSGLGTYSSAVHAVSFIRQSLNWTVLSFGGHGGRAGSTRGIREDQVPISAR